MHLDQLLSRFLAFLPTLAVLILVGVAGYFLSRLLSRGVTWGVRHLGIETFAERLGISRLLYAVGLRAGLATVAGNIAFWVGLLITVTMAAEIAGLSTVADAVTQLIAFLPRLLIALVAVVLGWRLADLVRGLVKRTAEGRLAAPNAIATAAYYLVLVLTFAFAANQAGLDTSLFDGLIQVIVAATVFGTALALALASRGTLAHLVARQYVTQLYKPGDTVRLGGDPSVEGTVVRYSGHAVLVAVGEETVVVPCGRLLDATVTVKPLLQAPDTRVLEEKPTIAE